MTFICWNNNDFDYNLKAYSGKYSIILNVAGYLALFIMFSDLKIL